MTGLERKNMATEILRQKAGGDISDDLEWTEDDILVIMDSYITQYLSQAILKQGRSAVNELWLRRLDCEDMKEECICGKMHYYYDIPFQIMDLPEDMGVFFVKYKLGRNQNAASKTSVEAANTAMPSIQNLRPLSYYLTGEPKRVWTTKKADKVSFFTIPIPSEVADDEMVALLPALAGRLWDDTMAKFLGVSEAKDRKGGNMIDSKE